MTQEQALKLFDYDPQTGRLTWKIKPAKNIDAGTPVGEGLDAYGYGQLCYRGKKYKAHRIAWLIVYGTLPDEIDHINRDRRDNRIANLRPATRQLNAQNRTSSRVFSFSGVYWMQRGKWAVKAKVRQKTVHLGTFESLLDAVAARISFERKHYQFSRFAAP